MEVVRSPSLEVFRLWCIMIWTSDNSGIELKVSPEPPGALPGDLCSVTVVKAVSWACAHWETGASCLVWKRY